MLHDNSTIACFVSWPPLVELSEFTAWSGNQSRSLSPTCNGALEDAVTGGVAVVVASGNLARNRSCAFVLVGVAMA